METITLNNKEYVKVSLLAKKYKYTADYIGQLCRSEKVDAELVGRTWYVNEDSLKSHKKSRYSKTRLNDKILEKTNKIEISRIRVEPVMTNRGTKLLKGKTTNFAKKIDWKPVKYEYDESELIPETNKGKKLPVDLADSNVIRISKSTSDTSFVSDGLPTIKLKGDLKIVSADIGMEDDLVVKNKDFSSEEVLKDEKSLNSKVKDSVERSEAHHVVKNNSEEINTSRNTSFLFNFFKIVIFLMIMFLVSLLIALISLNFSASNSDSFFEKGINFSVDFFSF